VPVGPLTLTDKGLDGVVVVTQEPGEVSGVIVDSQGNPLAGAQVRLELKSNGQWGDYAVADGAGAFNFKSVYAGEFVASAIVFGREKGSGLGHAIKDPVVCTVRPGEKVTGLKLVVQRDTGVISGTVRDAAGKPVEGVLLYVMRPQQDVGGPEEKFATDAEGRYRITGIASGDFDVFVQDSSNHYRPAYRTPVQAGSMGVDFTLHEAHFVEGCVVSAEDGKALAEFDLLLIARRYEEPITGPIGGDTIKDAEGRFRIMLRFEEATDITLMAGGPGYAPERVILPAVSPDKDIKGITLRLKRAGGVRGVVLGPDGKPKPGAKFVRGELAVVHEWDLFHTAAESAQDGGFEAKDLVPGPQVLTVYTPDCAPARVEVSPKSGETLTREIRLQKGATVEANFTVGGVPVDSTFRVGLNLGRGSETRPLGGGFVENGQSHLAFEHPLSPGRFWMVAEFQGKEGLLANVRREVTLEDGVCSTLEFDVPTGKCVLEGKYLAPEGAKSALISMEVPCKEGKAELRRWIKPGEFRIEGLPEFTGEAKVGAYVQQGDDRSVARTVPVALKAGEACRVDVDLR
jgi:hypothetical protein